jgi:hypothetical protein
MSLNKGNVLRVITSDDLVIHIKKKKSPTKMSHVDKEDGTSEESSSEEAGASNKRAPRQL